MWGSEQFLRYKIFNEMEAVGHVPRGTPSQSPGICLIIRNMNIDGLGVGIRMVSGILDH